jgi:drug/metabolite transporter (DMT)-like permease
MAGIALALAAAVAFALANTSAGVAYHSGSNPLTVAAIRFVLPTATLVAWLRMSGVPLARGRDGWLAASLGAVTALYTWALLSAIGAIPLALAILVFYFFPLVAIVILAVCGWEKFGWQTIAAIVLALFGLALALDPPGGNVNFEGVALALVGALALSTTGYEGLQSPISKNRSSGCEGSFARPCATIQLTRSGFSRRSCCQ